MLAYDSETATYWKARDLQLANHLLNTRATKPKWETISEIVKGWKSRHPKKWDAYLIHLKDSRENQKTTNVGSKRFRGVSRDKENDALLSQVVDFPIWIMQCIRKLFSDQELQFDKDFFRGFARRYPEFRIMEKIS